MVADLEYTDRLDRALETARLMCGMHAAYIYLRDEGGRRFLLTRSHIRAIDLTEDSGGEEHVLTAGSALRGSVQPEVPISPDLGAGAADMSPSPRLELPTDDEALWDATVITPAGRMHAMTLGLPGLPHEGLLMLGPMERDIPAAARRKIEAQRLCLTAVFVEARRLHAVTALLATARTQLDSASQLQGSALDADQFLALLLSLAVRATGASGGFVAVQDRDSTLHIRAAENLPDAFDEAMLDSEDGMFDWDLAGGGGALILRDVSAALACGFRSLLAVPLLEEDRPLGVMAIFRTNDGASMPIQALDMLESFADQGRLMLRKSQVFSDFATEFVTTLAGLAESLDARRAYTRGHHATVTALCSAIGQRLGLDADAIDAVTTAASIHDVGLAALAQRGRGTVASDVDHPTIGASLVSPLPLSPDVAAAIATHHEWFDGWGFPQGLSGREIPLAGRILAVAEFIAEMAAPDPVRTAWDEQRLTTELHRRSGSQFDPDVVVAAIPVLSLAVEALAGITEETQ
jgi:HD-GYP domain-containing protein (c-di-GMP phosphodiesterase class II)